MKKIKNIEKINRKIDDIENVLVSSVNQRLKGSRETREVSSLLKKAGLSPEKYRIQFSNEESSVEVFISLLEFSVKDILPEKTSTNIPISVIHSEKIPIYNLYRRTKKEELVEEINRLNEEVKRLKESVSIIKTLQEIKEDLNR